MPPTLFNPSPEVTDRVLHRFADHEVSFHDIADEFKTTVPALVLWLAKPEIAQRIADLRSAGAERTRTIAALYLPRTIPVLMRIIDSHDYDIGHRLDDPRDPATPILKLRERESVRKAITLIYRLANFTDKPSTSSATRTPSQWEGVGGGRSDSRSAMLTTESGTGVSPVELNSGPSPSRTSDLAISPARAIEVGAQHDFDAGSDSSNTRHAESMDVSSPASPRSSTPGHGCPEPINSIGVVVASGFASTVDSGPTIHESLITDPPSPITPHPFVPLDPLSIPSSSTSSSATSRSNPNTASALLERAGTNPRRSRAGPTLQPA